MRISTNPGRGRLLAIAASVLICGGALAATVSAQAGTAKPDPAPAAETVKVTNPGPTTEPLETAIDLKLTATDSVAADLPLTWSASANLTTLGLSIAPTNPPSDNDAAITGTATAAEAGTYAITVTATDSGVPAVAGTATFDLTLGNTITVTSPGAQSSAPDAVITPLPIDVTDTDTAATFTYAAAGLPTGLAIDPTTGVIGGTPTAVGTFDATVTVTDDTGATGAAKFTWSVGNKVTVTAPKTESTFLGLAVKAQATATDSDKSQTITWSAKSLPPGLSISAKTGSISGRTTKTGTFKSVVTATDTTGSAGSTPINWNVGTPITVHSAGSVTVTAGRSVAYKLAYTDVVKGDKVTWTAAGLPAGAGFQPSSLLLYGWPTGTGAHTVTFKAKGSLGTTDQKVLKLVVRAAPGNGAVGQIRLALDGKCLQDPDNRTANGTRVELEGCLSGSTERWTVASDNTVRVNGHCLNIAGNGGSGGRQVQLWNCNGGTRQVWKQGTDGQLVNPASGLCVTESSKSSGVQPTMGACHARSSEQWTLPPQPVLTAVGGMCLDDPLGKGANDTVVDQFSCNGTPGQAWDFQTNGLIRISQYANVCLTVHKSQPVLWVCGITGGQKWSVISTGGLGSELSAGGVCLATKSLTATSATKLVTTKCSASNPLDLWHVQ
jgi:hypothetical protein